MAFVWDDESTNLLLTSLRDKEHLYNRNHPNYKTYNVITECAELGKLFQPSKTGKEVLDKITSIRNDLLKIKKLIEENNCLDTNQSTVFHQCDFIYIALFGESSKEALKRRMKTEHDLIENVETYKRAKFSQHDFVEENIKVENDDSLMNQLNSAGKESQCDPSNLNTDSEEEGDSNFNNALSRGELLTDLIKFIRDKPFLWDFKHPSYPNYIFKRQILEEFRKTLKNPLPMNLIQNRVSYLRKRFFRALKSKGDTWHLFNDCKFFLNAQNNESRENADNEELAKNINLHKIIEFIKDKPFFYHSHHCKYFDHAYKNNILSDFAQSFDPPTSANALKKRISYLRAKFFKCMKPGRNPLSWRWFKDCKFFLKDSEKEKMKKKKCTKNLTSTSFSTHVSKSLSTNSKALTTDELIESKFNKEENNIFIPEEDTPMKDNLNDSIREIGIQCNLYEETLKEKIKDIQFKDCLCFEEISKFIENFKPLDQNVEFKEIASEISKTTEFVENYYEFETIEAESENLATDISYNDINLEEYSSDSSDYGLTEVPFPPKPKTWRKSVNKYECTQCSEKFNTHKLLDHHYTKLHAQRSLLCSICGKVNSSFRKMQMHENNCNPDENPTCYECNQVFKSKLIYHDHFNLVHDRKNPYVCSCGRSFMKYTKLVLHLNTYHCGTIDSCTIPEYVSKEFLESFVEVKNSNTEADVTETDYVERKLKFWCRICKTNFYNNRSYTAHLSRSFHLKAEKLWLEEFNIKPPFECEFCNKNTSVFDKIIDFVKHRHKFHRKCTLSDFFKKLEDSSDVPNVLLVEPTDHSNINSLCHICKNLFFMGDYEEHFKNSEHVILEKKWLEKSNIEEIECKTCSLKFNNLVEFLIHKRIVHDEWATNRLLKSVEGEINEEIPQYLINSKSIYKCSICIYYSGYKRAYIDHMLHHLAEKHIQCSCGERVITRVRLTCHQKRKGCSKIGCITPRFIPPTNATVNVNDI